MIPETLIFVPAAVVTVALLVTVPYLTISAWARERRREREAFYRHEALKRIAEQGEEGAASVLQFLREEAEREVPRRRRGLTLAAVINLAVGAGLLGTGILWRAGLVPLAIGAALAIYAGTLQVRRAP